MPGAEGPRSTPMSPVEPPAVEVERPSRRRWPRRRAVVLVLALAAIGIVSWTVVCALVAAEDLRSVRADLSRLTASHPNRAQLERELQHDISRVDHARSLLGQPGPVVFGWVPIVGRNVTAERVVADASREALRSGLALSRSTRGLGTGAGGIDLARVSAAADAVSDAADQLQPSLRKLANQQVAWTLPPVTDGVRQARNQLLDLGQEMRRAAVGLHALPGVLGGSGRRTVEVVLMNNAELRGAGGLPSAFATGTLDNGQLDLTPFRDVNTVAQRPAQARRVPAPREYHAAYGIYLADSTLWKNTTMSPQDPETAQVLAAVAATSVHVQPDVVVLCDVPGAAAIISATGPVTINGELVTGAELTRRLLVDAYGDGSLSEAKQQRRRQVLDDAATQAFARLRHGASSTPELLRALSSAVSGRHLALWSARAQEQAQLVAAGAAGAVDPHGGDVAMVTTNNLGDSPLTGNKLDYYVSRTLDVSVRLTAHRAAVTQTVVLRNTAPTGLGPYVEGVAHPGSIRELLAMSVARDANVTGFTRDGQPVDVSVTTSSGAQQLTTALELARGTTTAFRVSYTVPVRSAQYRLTLVPQPLAQPARLHLHISADDAELGVVSGMRQPVRSTVDAAGPWNAVQDIVIPVHALHGPRAWLHAIAHFWSHQVSL